MKALSNAYTLPTVIIIITILTMTFSITALYITHFISASYRQINASRGWSDHYLILEEIRPEFEQDIQDEYTSPWSGWYSRLPVELDGFSLTYSCEDSKLDINHLDPAIITGSGYATLKLQEKKDIPAYYFYPEEVDAVFENGFAEQISIYQVPNLNTATPDAISYFLLSQKVDESTTNAVVSYVKKQRSKKKYLTHKGLLIGEQQYDHVRYLFPRKEQDDAYKLLDYTGRLNCNFVNKQSFLIAAKTCNPSKSSTPEAYWNIVENHQNSGTTISDIKDVFGNQWHYYQKFFSVDSNLFTIQINRDTKAITAMIRRYKDFRGQVKTSLMLLRAYEIEKVE
jgi:hypothetical protein